MATKTVTSEKSATKVGANDTKLYTATRTTYNVDSNGKIDPDTVKHELLYWEAPLGSPVVAATSTGTSNDWTFTNKALSSNPILGADAQKSLKSGRLKDTTEQQITDTASKNGVSAEQQKSLSTKQLNTAATTEEINDEQLTEALAKEAKGTRNSFKNLKYPESLQASHQDVIKFNMVKYAPKKFDSSQTDNDLNPFAGRRKITDEVIIGSVTLPIPGNVNDNMTVNWSEDKLNPLQSNLVNIAMSGITGGVGDAAETTSDTVDSISENAGDVKTAVANIFAEQATGTTNLLSRTRGAIYNPNMELLFNSPQLRPFSFSFKLSGRSSRESQTIRDIIRFFKQGMSPIRTESQLFLKAPHTFKIEYLHRGEEHRYINKIKECALQAFSVNYTPEGNYATFTDSAMTSYEITMQFQELEPIFNDDYSSVDNNQDTHIGY